MEVESVKSDKVQVEREEERKTGKARERNEGKKTIEVT